MSGLPRTWVEARLGELAQVVRGVTYKKHQAQSEDADGFVPILRATNVANGLVLDSNLVYVPEQVVRAEQLLRVGDIVLAASSGSQAVVGKSAMLKQHWRGGFGAFCAVLRPSGLVDARYVGHFVSSPGIRRRWSGLAAGTNINNLKREHLEGTTVPLAPLGEQRRIVAAIEEQFSRVDAADELLQRSMRRLDALKRAAVADAFRDSELAVPIAQAADDSKNALAIGPFGSNLKVSDYREGGVPLIFVRNIRAQSFAGPHTKYISPEKARELASHTVRPGDVLITKMGDPPGDTAVYPEQANAILTADCIKISLSSSFDARFVALAIRAPRVRRQILAITSGVAQKKVSLSRFKGIRIPAPSLDEQRRIVAEVERQLSIVDAMAAQVDAALRRSNALRRAILQQAFTGKLVAQDPTDEPASVLLERIAAERASSQIATGGRRRRRATMGR